MKNDKLLRAYELGHTTAMACYLRVPEKSVTNPYTHKALRLEWARGWRGGCEEYLQRLQYENKVR